MRDRKKECVGRRDQGHASAKSEDGFLHYDFCVLISRVPVDVFVRMAMKSGLPPLEQRVLCDAFKRLKG